MLNFQINSVGKDGKTTVITSKNIFKTLGTKNIASTQNRYTEKNLIYFKKFRRKLLWLFWVQSDLSGNVSAMLSYATWRNASTVQVPGLLLYSRLPNRKSGPPDWILFSLFTPRPKSAAKHLGPTGLSKSWQPLAVLPDCWTLVGKKESTEMVW